MNFSKDHIIRYLNGELPHYEQHELEKLMLEDPFLADAIEGLQQIDDPEKLNEAIAEIEGSIEDKYGKVRVMVPIYRNPLAIAAVVSLVVISVAVVLLVPDYRQKVQSFLITTKQESKDDPPASSDREETAPPKSEIITEKPAPDTSSLETEEEGEPRPLLTEAEESEDTASIVSELQLPVEPVDNDTGQIIAAEQDIDQGLAIEDTISELDTDTGIAGVTEEAMEFADAEEQPLVEGQEVQPAMKARAREDTEDLRSVSGTVVSSEDNQPLPGVNVLVKGTSKGTVTDMSGSYTLQLDQGQNELQYSFIGFQTHEQAVSQPGTYNVTLQSDPSKLAEMVVIGYGTEDKRLGTDRFASPLMGREQYDQYLNQNLIYPDSASANGITGQVIVEFTVTAEGDVQNIQVIQGLGYGCDDEAVRLVREGPAWNPAIRNGVPTEEKVRVAIRFRPGN